MHRHPTTSKKLSLLLLLMCGGVHAQNTHPHKSSISHKINSIKNTLQKHKNKVGAILLFGIVYKIIQQKSSTTLDTHIPHRHTYNPPLQKTNSLPPKNYKTHNSSQASIQNKRHPNTKNTKAPIPILKHTLDENTAARCPIDIHEIATNTWYCQDPIYSDLYYTIEKIGPHNATYWWSFYDYQAQQVMYDGGVNGCMNSLELYNKGTKDDLWICYATSEMPSSKIKARSASFHSPNDYIEMVLSIYTNREVPISTHIGIFRTLEYGKNRYKKKGAMFGSAHKGISPRLHAYGALFLQLLYPQVEFMITSPLPTMRSIMQYEYGDREPPIMWTGDDDTRQKFKEYSEEVKKLIDAYTPSIKKEERYKKQLESIEACKTALMKDDVASIVASLGDLKKGVFMDLALSLSFLQQECNKVKADPTRKMSTSLKKKIAETLEDLLLYEHILEIPQDRLLPTAQKFQIDLESNTIKHDIFKSIASYRKLKKAYNIENPLNISPIKFSSDFHKITLADPYDPKKPPHTYTTPAYFNRHSDLYKGNIQKPNTIFSIKRLCSHIMKG